MMHPDHPRVDWRVKTGFAFLVVSIGWPVLLPILLFLGVSKAVTAAIGGFMLVGAEFLLIAGAAIAGKEGFAFLKARAFGFLRSYGPPREVSRFRYQVGLLMFVIPLVFGWAAPYLGQHLPGFERGKVIYAIAGDICLASSLFVLGGAFWDKLRSLFRYDAHAVIPDEPRPESVSK